MGLHLTIDQGNSSAKIAVWNGDTLVMYLAVPCLDTEVLDHIIDKYHPTNAIFCSVAEQQEYISSELSRCGIDAHELTSLTPVPMTIDYGTPGTLGVDRIAAAIGAMNLYPSTELLVVDAGTAVTYDRVTSRGHFAGGNIAPGVGMRLRALNAYTARLPMISSRGETRLWGNTTEVAMRSGALNGVVAEISYYRSRLPEEARVVITGGWGPELASKLDFEADCRQALVNRGLNVILNNMLS